MSYDNASVLEEFELILEMLFKIRKNLLCNLRYLFESYEKPLDCDSFSIRIRVERNVHILATYYHF